METGASSRDVEDLCSLGTGFSDRTSPGSFIVRATKGDRTLDLLFTKQVLFL